MEHQMIYNLCEIASKSIQDNSNKKIVLKQMKQDTFLLSLISFSDLKPTSCRQLVSISNSNQSGKQNRLISSPYKQLELQIYNNQNLLKNYKQLRQQLIESTKICQLLRKKYTEKQNEIQLLKIREKQLQISIVELRNQLQHKNDIIQSYKMKNCCLISKSSQESQILLKKTIQQLKSKVSQIEKQKYQVIQMSIIEKIKLQQKIKKYQVTKITDLNYLRSIQSQLNLMKEKSLKLQNDLKNLQIKYDQQKYKRKWDQKTFQIQYLMSQLKKQQKQNAELYSDLKKQKELNNQLESKIHQLEQNLQIFKVKSQTYMLENISLHKKTKNIQKNYEKKSLCIDAKDQQIAKVDKKLLKTYQLYEELISKIKRQGSGDLISFVKKNQYKFNKIRQNNRFNSSTKALSQTHKKEIKKQRKKPQCKKQNAQRYFLNTQRIQNVLFNKTLEKFDIIHTQVTQNSNKRDKVIQTGFLSGQIAASEKQNIYQKIKRQRDKVQKKIRQKMLKTNKQLTNQLQNKNEEQKFLSYIKN